MAVSKNLVVLAGYLAEDAELTHKGTFTVLRFRVAVTEKWKNKKTRAVEEHTEFVRCVVKDATHNGMTSDHTVFLDSTMKRGAPVLVTGRLRTRRWETSEGVKREVTEVRADDVQLIPRASR